jgi:hypothetical protein
LEFLLGIPLPPIYVATNDKGVWEVIDGVQRLSTIFEFMGELLGPPPGDGREMVQKPGLVLEATKHLRSLEGASFSAIDSALRLEFKRTRLDVKVLGRGQKGASTGKFDLFERLNTYGEPLSPQELRNCVLVSLNPEMFRWLRDLSEDANFRACTLLSDTQLREKYDMDLASRFLLLRDVDPKAVGDVHEFLRDRMEEVALDPDFNYEVEEKTFREVFAFLNEKTGINSFRGWNEKTKLYRGGFSLAAYEGLGLSMGRLWGKLRGIRSKFNVEKVVQEIWNSEAYKNSFSGLRARERMARVGPVAKQVVESELHRILASAKKRARKS